MKESFDVVWQKILANQGGRFSTKNNEFFTYRIENDKFIPLRPRIVAPNIPKSMVEQAYNLWPVSEFPQTILASSYIFGLFNDARIVAK